MKKKIRNFIRLTKLSFKITSGNKKKKKLKKKGYGPPRSRRFEWSCMNIMQHGGKKSIVVNKSPNVKRNKSPSQILDGFDIDEESLRHT